MKFIKYILCSTALALCLAACGKNDTITPEQQDDIVNFLQNHDLDYDLQNGVYRHFGKRNSSAQLNPIQKGDYIEFMFEIYPAIYSYKQTQTSTVTPIPTTAIFSNKQYIIDTLKSVNPNFNPQWNTEPYKTYVGEKNIIEGLNRGLIGCNKGDSVLLFITGNLAFKNKTVANVEPNSALLYIVSITNVNNQ